jgi:hypothetical protein
MHKNSGKIYDIKLSIKDVKWKEGKICFVENVVQSY